MRMSVPGNSRGNAGFTLIEVIVVMALVAIGTALVSLALRDGAQSRLDEEGVRLSALLESARAEARASGLAVSWAPAEPGGAGNADGAQFRFNGLPQSAGLPTRWLVEGVSAEIVGTRALVLGPEPVLPAQRLVLHLEDRRLVLASDGLAPFAPVDESATP